MFPHILNQGINKRLCRSVALVFGDKLRPLHERFSECLLHCFQVRAGAHAGAISRVLAVERAPTQSPFVEAIDERAGLLKLGFNKKRAGNAGTSRIQASRVCPASLQLVAPVRQTAAIWLAAEEVEILLAHKEEIRVQRISHLNASASGRKGGVGMITE